MAISSELLHWEKYPANPLFPIEADKSSGILVHDGQCFRLYTMHKKIHVHISTNGKEK